LTVTDSFGGHSITRRIGLLANNHYQGHGPDTVKTFWQLWKD
jgi:hypothetical protein